MQGFGGLFLGQLEREAVIEHLKIAAGAAARGNVGGWFEPFDGFQEHGLNGTGAIAGVAPGKRAQQRGGCIVGVVEVLQCVSQLALKGLETVHPSTLGVVLADYWR